MIDQVSMVGVMYPSIDLMKIVFGVHRWIEVVPMNLDGRVCLSIDLMRIMFGTHSATSLGTAEIKVCLSIDLIKIMFGTHSATNLETAEIKMNPSIDLRKNMIGGQLKIDVANREIRTHPSIDLINIMFGMSSMVDRVSVKIQVGYPSIDLMQIMIGIRLRINAIDIGNEVHPSSNLMNIMIGVRWWIETTNSWIKTPGGGSGQVDVTVTSQEQGERVETIETPVMKTKTRTTVSRFTGYMEVRVDATEAGIRRQRYQRRGSYKTVTKGK
jgi:hypothetical protein